MAKYLRPRRGSKANAVAQKILLKKGEMFMEFPNSEIGKGPGRIIMGDGATSYQNMDYGTTATNVFRPFITDPEIFIPHFTNTNPSTASWTVNAGTEAIAKMGDGSSASTVALPTIIGAVKETLCKHADSITKLNNDLYYKSGEVANFNNRICLPARLGFSRTRIFVSFPLPKFKLDYTITNIQLEGDGKIPVYCDNTVKNCTVNLSNYSVYFVGKTLTVLFGVTPDSSWSTTGDALALVELDSSRYFKITF